MSRRVEPTASARARRSRRSRSAWSLVPVPFVAAIAVWWVSAVTVAPTRGAQAHGLVERRVGVTRCHSFLPDFDGPHAPERGVLGLDRLPIGDVSSFYLGHLLGRISCKLVANLLPTCCQVGADACSAWNMAENRPTFNRGQVVVNRLILQTVGEGKRPRKTDETRARKKNYEAAGMCAWGGWVISAPQDEHAP